MTRKQFLKTTCAAFGIAAMLSNSAAFAGVAVASGGTINTGTGLTTAQKIAAIKAKVKYVFVIFHENESFDHFFGTFPGANGLFSAPAGVSPANATPSFTQAYLNTDGTLGSIQPFLMPQAVQRADNTVVPIYPADYVSVDHSHQGMSNSLDVIGGTAQNDRYAIDNEGFTTNAPAPFTATSIVQRTGAPVTTVTLGGKQRAEADVSHIDCDTIPFMWSWAKNFVLFDDFHQSIVGPSTPNAIAVIAGQSGQTQWALHPADGATVTYAGSLQVPFAASYGSQQFAGNSSRSNYFVPVVNDPGPFPGSRVDTSAVKPPYNFDESPTNPTLTLTFASLPLSFMGSNIKNIIAADQNPRADLIDVQHDILTIATNNPVVNWGWYQQGFNGNDASDPYEPQGTGTPNPTNNPGLYTGYILHHNGPQYFGYLGDNTNVLANNLHGAADFFTAVENQQLPSNGGVFYLRGGYDNNDSLVPIDPTPAIQHAFIGNDDHPAYSDQQISEAFAARAISDIANSPYWSQSVTIITYDETDGFYDHVAPHVRSTFVDGSPLAAGPRIPTILISPYAAAGTISHQYSEHSSIIKFINELFGLVPLANLPDEQHGKALGLRVLGQANLGPADDPTNEVGDLTEAFDYDILAGTKTPLPASLAIFTKAQWSTLPHLAGTASPNGYTNGACAAIGMLPTDFPTQAAYTAGQPIDAYPLDVNPRPSQSVGSPYYNTNSSASLSASTGPWVP